MHLQSVTGLCVVQNEQDHGEQHFTPEDVFAYIYAVLHCPSYRERYGEHLKRDFPRIPLPPDAAFFRALAEAGGTLIGLHLLRQRGETPAGFPIASVAENDRVVEKVEHWPPTADRPGRVFINEAQYFEDVPSEVWAFQVGGHQVCEKWLKDRKGRRLSHEEITTYCRIVGALRDTLDIMRRIDATVAAHGGWPLSPPDDA